MTTNPPLNIDDYFKSLKIVHLAFLAGQIMFCGIACFLVFPGNLPASVSDVRIFNLIVPFVAAAGVAASIYLFRNKLETVKGAANTDEKLTIYRAALIMKYALIEGPSLFAIVVFLLTGLMLPHLVVAGLLIAWFALQHPGRVKATDDLGLDETTLMEWERSNDARK